MKKAILITLIVTLFTALGAVAEQTVTVELNYGSGKEIRSVEVTYKDKMTALDALMHAAEITTHPLKEYVFVSAIDGVKSKRGKMAWYYKINGKSTHKLAIEKEIKAGDKISWLYIKDVCSATVDGCPLSEEEVK